MEPTRDRRNDRSERAPVRIAAELGHQDFRDAFEADVLNLSTGGISMRAACLPDMHSRLLCRFSCLPSGAAVTAQGEVVWAHLDGEHSGEFGLAFVDLDPKTEWLIEEMIAEHAARSEGDCGAQGPLVATLELEGSPEPIAARLASEAGASAVFEQQLDLLSLGRAVLAHAGGSEGRAGSIAAVELRMVGNVPMLAVTVAFEKPNDYGEFSWSAGEPQSALVQGIGEREANRALGWDPAGIAGEPGRADAFPDERTQDTEPDLVAPPEAAQATSDFTHVTVTEFGRTDAGRTDAGGAEAPEDETQLPVAEGEAVDQPPAWAISPLGHAPRIVLTEAPAETPRPERKPDREFSHTFVLEQGDESELEAELAAFAGPAWKPLVAAAARALWSHLKALLALLGASGGTALHKALPKLRGALLASGSGLRAAYSQRIGLRLGAARRLLLVLLPSRRRRTASVPSTTLASSQRRRRGSSSLGRTALVGVIGAGAAGLLVYAFAPSPHGDGVDLGRRVQPAEAPLQAGAESGAEPSTHAAAAEPVVPVAPTGLAAGVVPGAAPQPNRVPAKANAVPAATAHAPPAALPSAERVPSSSPFAVDLRPGASAAANANPGAKPEPSRKLRFGAATVPKGRRFALRMSGRIQSLQGVADKGGFTLTIPGTLSLDRAGPISSAVKSVQRAMVVNKGDHAELSIRFADGKQPAYQVSADGSTLYLVIEDG
jgi:hypothetical protein